MQKYNCESMSQPLADFLTANKFEALVAPMIELGAVEVADLAELDEDDIDALSQQLKKLMRKRFNRCIHEFQQIPATLMESTAAPEAAAAPEALPAMADDEALDPSEKLLSESNVDTERECETALEEVEDYLHDFNLAGYRGDAMRETGTDMHARIMLIGSPGSGKSSFINTAACVLEGKPFEDMADSCPTELEIGTFTTEMLTYPVYTQSEHGSAVFVTDTRGYDALTDKQMKHVCTVLTSNYEHEGLRCDQSEQQEMKWQQRFGLHAKQLLEGVRGQHHCLCIFIDANRIWGHVHEVHINSDKYCFDDEGAFGDTERNNSAHISCTALDHVGPLLGLAAAMNRLVPTFAIPHILFSKCDQIPEMTGKQPFFLRLSLSRYCLCSARLQVVQEQIFPCATSVPAPGA
jgi:hypothetical protein